MAQRERLSNNSLARLPAGVAAPGYDRRSIKPGIFHLGVGASHRAHQAVYVDDCLAEGEAEWGIVGAWSGLVVLICVRLVLMLSRFRGRRWLVTGWA